MALPYPRVINLGDGTLDARAVQGNFEVVDQWFNVGEPEPWHYVGDATTGLGSTFASGKINFGSGYEAVRFRMDRRRVYIEGAIYDNTGATANLLTLPTGYRPTNTQSAGIANPGGAGSFMQVLVASTGVVTALAFAGSACGLQLSFGLD
jgi:hypothetical protein